MTPEHRATARWLILAASVWLTAMAITRWKHEPAPAPLPAWQHPITELPPAQHHHYLQLREAILTAERARSTGAWPTTFLPGYTLRQQRLTINYVGEAEGLRWLVLFLEPDPRVPPEHAPPDDEHHALPDGTALHVTVWTQPLAEPAPESVTAFPAAEGWVERVRR